MITVGDLHDGLNWLHANTYLVPKHQRRGLDALDLAARMTLEAVKPEPTGQQWRDTRHDPLPTQVHAGYAETQLERRP